METKLALQIFGPTIIFIQVYQILKIGWVPSPAIVNYSMQDFLVLLYPKGFTANGSAYVRLMSWLHHPVQIEDIILKDQWPANNKL